MGQDDGIGEEEGMLLSFVRGREVLCPVCGYNLRELTVARCPECGRGLRLTVGTMEPFMAAWIVGAIGAFGSSAIAVLLLAFTVVRGAPGIRHFDQYVAFYSFVGSIPIAIALLLGRRRYLRLGRGVQWAMSLVVLGLTVLQILSFVILIR